MRRTRKHIKKLRRTCRRGGGGNNLKKILPVLPRSPPPTPPRAPNSTRPELKVSNMNLKPVEPYTYNWWKRQEVKKELEKAGEQSYWKRLLGIKEKVPERVPLNSEGYPIKSAFNINKNRGFQTKF